MSYCRRGKQSEAAALQPKPGELPTFGFAQQLTIFAVTNAEVYTIRCFEDVKKKSKIVGTSPPQRKFD